MRSSKVLECQELLPQVSESGSLGDSSTITSVEYGLCDGCSSLADLDAEGYCQDCEHTTRICPDCGDSFRRRKTHGGRICGRCRYLRRTAGKVKYRRPQCGLRWRLQHGSN